MINVRTNVKLGLFETIFFLVSMIYSFKHTNRIRTKYVKWSEWMKWEYSVFSANEKKTFFVPKKSNCIESNEKWMKWILMIDDSLWRWRRRLQTKSINSMINEQNLHSIWVVWQNKENLFLTKLCKSIQFDSKIESEINSWMNETRLYNFSILANWLE